MSLVDAASSHLITAEVRSLQTQLAVTRRELKDVVRTKAYRYELLCTRATSPPPAFHERSMPVH